MLDFLGGLIGAGTKLLGGILGQSSADKQAEANRAAQMELAQHGVQIKARDARAAEQETGINALTLLGAPTSSFSNVVGSTSLADSIGSAGQDLGRAIAAGSDKRTRADELNEELLAAKIANVNADTVRLQAGASALMTRLGQPGTAPGIPLPPEDPRGPVINLMQRARDRDGNIVWIPSEKAASPLQTLAASPINAAIAGSTVWDAVRGDTRPLSIQPGGSFVAPGQAARQGLDYNWTYGAP